MADEEPTYVESSADGKAKTLLPDALVDRELIEDTGFYFSFPEVNDITDNLKKNKDKTKAGNRDEDNILNAQNSGRLYYGRLKVTYPNNEWSNTVAFKDCIIQYSPSLEKSTTTYADSFLIIGIPQHYIDKLKLNAKHRSGITLKVKDKVKQESGQYWFGCNIEKVANHKLTIINGPANHPYSVDIKKYLTVVKRNITCNIQFEVSATATTKSILEKIPDIKSADCFITIKPTDIQARSMSTIEGPKGVDFTAVVSESLSVGIDSYADDELVKIAQQMSM